MSYQNKWNCIQLLLWWQFGALLFNSYSFLQVYIRLYWFIRDASIDNLEFYSISYCLCQRILASIEIKWNTLVGNGLNRDNTSFLLQQLSRSTSSAQYRMKTIIFLSSGYAADNITHCIRPQDITERRCVIILRRLVDFRYS